MKNVCKEFDAFLLHVFSDSQATVFECGVVIRIDRDLIEPGEIDPLRDKVLNKPPSAFVSEQAVHLLLDRRFIKIVMLSGQRGQLGIRRTVPEEVRQARGQVISVILAQVQKTRVAKDRDD